MQSLHQGLSSSTFNQPDDRMDVKLVSLGYRYANLQSNNQTYRLMASASKYSLRIRVWLSPSVRGIEATERELYWAGILREEFGGTSGASL